MVGAFLRNRLSNSKQTRIQHFGCAFAYESADLFDWSANCGDAMHWYSAYH